MRLRRLHLVRYGRFEDAVLDFGENDDRADVTVLLGENEAGKSTAFMAWLDLLYGLKSRNHPYDFRFGRKDLEVAADIGTQYGPLSLRRTASLRDSLLDADRRPVPEERLTRLLSGLDRNGYRTRFSLDDQVLREGGEAIAKAEGDLGRLLHVGSTGLGGLSGALDAMRDRADAFYKKRGRSTTLATARKALEDLEAKLDVATLTPARQAELEGRVMDAGVAYDAARAGVDDARRATKIHASAVRRAEHGAEIDRIDAQLRDCPDGDDLPPRAFERMERAEERILAARKDVAEANAALVDAEQALAEHPVDPVANELAAEVARIDSLTFDGVALVSRAATALGDVSKRRERLEAGAARLAGLAADVAGPSATPDDLMMSTERVNELGAAIDRLNDARSREELVHQSLSEAIALLADTAEPSGLSDVAALQGALAAFDAAERATRYEAELRKAETERDVACAALPADWHTLSPDGLPSQELIEQRGAVLAETHQALRVAEERLGEARAARDEARASHEAVARRPDAVSAGAVSDALAARDESWAQHREALTEETAAQFEASMREHDRRVADHAAGSGARARLLACEEALAAADAELYHRRGYGKKRFTRLARPSADSLTWPSGLACRVTPANLQCAPAVPRWRTPALPRLR